LKSWLFHLVENDRLVLQAILMIFYYCAFTLLAVPFFFSEHHSFFDDDMIDAKTAFQSDFMSC